MGGDSITTIQKVHAMPGNRSDYLILKNVSKAYLEGDRVRQILEDASMSFARGEFSAILGKSGSGKTTLLNLISGIDLVDNGRIILDSEDLTSMDSQAMTIFRRQHIGFIFQFFNLISTLNVWENITLPLELNGIADQDGLDHARDLLNEVGLGDRASTFPDRLSGGERQRVAIARALVHNPLLVLADEPTGNLDEETGRLILDLLDRITRRAGKNLIMVTHSPEAAGYADRILCLSDCKIMEKQGAVPCA
jgi:putative ABC transport system ATP-binding protein